ncbi:NDR1/HIN1-like protein 26 [Curcuma longa]|uniref:NDR1/HIN1-like protein 26 n=1 Tax=Curcuma longa TaxID=136217 RepID=UPI003D9E7F26
MAVFLRDRARSTSRRVLQSLTSRFVKCLCSVLLFLLLVTGVILFVLWLSLRPHRPRFHLAAFSAPGVADAAGLADLAFAFNVTDRNPNQKIGIYYGAISGAVYYQDQQVASGPVMLPFYQPPKNTTAIAGKMAGTTIPSGSAMAAQLAAQAAAGRIELRLELSSVIRFKVRVWDTRQHHLHVQCNLAVGSDGEILPESKGVRCSMYF